MYALRHIEKVSASDKRPVQLLADDFARNGYKVVVTDLFEGDPVPDSRIRETT